MSFRPHVSVTELRRPRLDASADSRTVQSDKDRTDIRNIVKRAMRGATVNVNVREGRFEDISSAPTYMQALNQVAVANELFANLPSSVRDRFANDPIRMLMFLDNPDNKDESIKLGLRKPDPVPPSPPDPISVRVVSDPPKS